MHARRQKPQTPDGFVRLLLPKGVVCILTAMDYRAGLARGKAFRRAERQAAREQTHQTRHEADALSWLEEEKRR